MKQSGIEAVFHYVPLHNSPAGKRYGRVSGELPYTIDLSQRIIRLPLWGELSEDDIAYVIESLEMALV